jgi:hypothetical protein
MLISPSAPPSKINSCAVSIISRKSCRESLGAQQHQSNISLECILARPPLTLG